ncbi:hypothetical protein RIF29_16128 [Crotalaria pallida]|uniref:J domain-containing protein n=1 Tax=Crotalaria pallida TaxID=3830 RepID=A0AAN9FEJ2_CROPI
MIRLFLVDPTYIHIPFFLTPDSVLQNHRFSFLHFYYYLLSPFLLFSVSFFHRAHSPISLYLFIFPFLSLRYFDSQLLFFFHERVCFASIQMIGKGVFRENFQPQTCSRKKAPRTDQENGKLKKVITIDLDSDDVDDVVILEFDEFFQQNLPGSSVPSKERVCTPQSVISIDDDDDDDDDDDESDDADHTGNIAEGVGESDSDSTSSKRFSPTPICMQNCVHIDVDDSHVCEKDFVSNKEKNKQTCSAKATGRNRYGLDRSESESSESDCSDCEVVDVREQWERASVKRKRHVFNDQFCHDQHASSSGFPNNGKDVKGGQSSFSTKGDSQVNGISSNLGAENPLKDSGHKVDQESSKFSHRSTGTECGKRAKSKEVSPCSRYKYYNKCDFCIGVTGASMSDEEFGGKKSKTTSLGQEEAYERQGDNNGSAMRDKDSGASTSEKELGGKESKTTNLGHKAYEKQVDNSGSTLRNNDDNLSEVNTADSNRASFDESHVNCNELPLHAQNGGFNTSNQRDIINEREKLKETDEYKRVMEEEWASRQLQLQIQAEEAQRLRKRKKAEAQRLLDMQRRQKERIEEVRETQKKDEEFMNMKEQLRVEIQWGLKKLEMQCSDMASLLRGLGIHVGGGFNPLADEVRAAYKRALLKFHPDRASKADIRGQVEAEEKFKLISRMKDKLL